MRSDSATKERVLADVKATGVLPCIKLHQKEDWVKYAQAMYDGGARCVEITMTTPGVLEAVEAISTHFKGKMHVAVGTVLDACSAREAILHGADIIVNPCIVDDVTDVANRYQAALFCGAFTATEVFNAMRKGVTAVKIFPGALGGPKYMTNLKMVFPEVNLIPSGGVTESNAGEFIRCGACAVSGARTFMNFEKIEQEGVEWITRQVARFVEIVREAKKDLPDIP